LYIIGKNSKNGSFTSFLAIILTSVVILMSVLMKASSIRYDETLLAGILVKQQDLVLSDYCEKLLDWYGIYATQILNPNEYAFAKSTNDIANIEMYSCKGIQLLESDNNYKQAILAFSKPRFPMQFITQIMSRFTDMNSIISNQKTMTGESFLQENPFAGVNRENINGNDPNIGGQFFSFDKIIELLSLINRNDFETNTDTETKKSVSWEDLNDLLKNNNSNQFYEMDISKQIKSSLSVTENNLNEMSLFLEQFYQIESNDFYDKLCFEFYISSMFSCKTNVTVDNGVEIEKKDMRNRAINSLPTKTEFEIEKIIFGYEKEETNEFLAKTSIESIRFLIHLITNITDTTKLNQIKAASLSLCATLAVVSGGTVIIPPEIMDTVILILKSISSSTQDYSKLSKGESVPLLPLNKTKNIDTFYTDYLQIFLLIVPEKTKMNRMLEIVKDNLYLGDTNLYTGVSVGIKYRGNPYFVEGRYYGNDSNK